MHYWIVRRYCVVAYRCIATRDVDVWVLVLNSNCSWNAVRLYWYCVLMALRCSRIELVAVLLGIGTVLVLYCHCVGIGLLLLLGCTSPALAMSPALD